MLSTNLGFRVYIDYFTDYLSGYKESVDKLQYRFFPLKYSFKGDHKKFRKQYIWGLEILSTRPEFKLMCNSKNDNYEVPLECFIRKSEDRNYKSYEYIKNLLKKYGDSKRPLRLITLLLRMATKIGMYTMQ